MTYYEVRLTGEERAISDMEHHDMIQRCQIAGGHVTRNVDSYGRTTYTLYDSDERAETTIEERDR